MTYLGGGVCQYNETPDAEYVYVAKDCEGYYYGMGYAARDEQAKSINAGIKQYSRRQQVCNDLFGGRRNSKYFTIYRIKKSTIPSL